MVEKERAKGFLALWTVAKMNPQMRGVLTVALVATKVNFVIRHVAYCITRTSSCRTTTVKFLRCNGNLTWLALTYS
jgi:hypothetical protein